MLTTTLQQYAKPKTKKQEKARKGKKIEQLKLKIKL